MNATEKYRGKSCYGWGGREWRVKMQSTYCINDIALAERESESEKEVVREGDNSKTEIRRVKTSKGKEIKL